MRTIFFLQVKNAAEFRLRLLQHGVLVRDCTSFGLPDHVRIAVKNAETTGRLLRALDQIMPAGNRTAEENDAAWSSGFREQLFELFKMRRDVRRFRREDIPADALRRWIEAACLAPSVGHSQPWRFVSVRDAEVRQRVTAEFEFQNESAAKLYDGDTAAQYRKLKLAGLREAPEHLAVFQDTTATEGRGLGQQTMPETAAYSVVAAIQNLWLAARSEGVGVGWVSILCPEKIAGILGVPEGWRLIAYLCLGYPEEENQAVPELMQLGWQERLDWNEHWRESTS